MLTGGLLPKGTRNPVFGNSFVDYTAFAVGAAASLESKTLSVEPGSVATVRVKIQNTGQVVDEFTVDVLGDAAGWSAATPPMVRLFPGQEEIVTVAIRPPRSAQTRAGEIPFAVRVQSREDPQGSTVEEGRVTVGSFAEAAAELIPRNSRGSRRGSHEVVVDNGGNAPMQAALTAGDQDKQLDFTLSPATLTVAPGSAGFARLRVRPKQTFWRGQPKTKAFQVMVQPDGRQPIVLDGSLVQGPMLAPWMVPVAMGLVALLIAAALLWNLVLVPGVTSIARDAVVTPSPAGSTSGGNPPPGGGKSPAPTTGPTSNPAAGGINFAQRLTPSASYKTPAATTLYVTDLVFNNPSAESGPISLTRDGQILLQEDLKNFRDLDYHFVTPIQLNANQTIALSGSCSACSVLVSGYEKT